MNKISLTSVLGNSLLYDFHCYSCFYILLYTDLFSRLSTIILSEWFLDEELVIHGVTRKSGEDVQGVINIEWTGLIFTRRGLEVWIR